MSKILSIDLIFKNLKCFFSKSAPKAENIAVEKTEQVIEENAKVTSKQIEAYYKRYEKCLKKPIPKVKEAPKKRNVTDLEKKIQKECNAYDRARYIDVSEEALKGLEHNFEEKRNKVIKIISDNPENLSPLYLKEVKQIKKPKDLSLIIRSYVVTATYELNQKYDNLIKQVIKSKKMSLKDQQKLFKEEKKICDVYLELIKAVTEPSKDPRVLQIEEQIKSMYNMDYVHLESLEEAQKILRTIKLALKNDIPLPKNIIVTPFTMIQTTGINLTHTFSEHSVVVNSQKNITEAKARAYKQFTMPESKPIVDYLKAQDAKWSSTDDELQTYTHEFVHTKYFLELLMPMKAKQPIPEKYHKTVQEVGTYAISSRSELVTELKTKAILRSLNKDEKELLAYFE